MTLQNLLRQGASISRDRNINLDYAKVADEAADYIDELEEESTALGIVMAERDEYQREADMMAASHKVERTYGRRINFTEYEVEFNRVHGEIQRLAVSIWSNHYRTSAPDWQVLGDTYGALSQISNMVAGMSRDPAPLRDADEALMREVYASKTLEELRDKIRARLGGV